MTIFRNNHFVSRGCIGSRTCRSCGNIWTGTCLCIGSRCPKCDSNDSFETGNDPRRAEAVARDEKYWEKKFPGRRVIDGKLIFFWTQAYAGVFDHHYILPDDTWDKLSDYDSRDRSCLSKYYESADRAVRDLITVVGAAEEIEESKK